MDEPEVEHQESLPTSTVPAEAQLSLRGLGTDSEWNERFKDALLNLVVACGRCMDLRLLDGLTVGFDYDDALDSVDLGYTSSIAKGYTNSGGLIGVGKMLRVKRKDQLKAHVVLDANYLGALVDIEHEEFWPTANIVAHELAHVAIVNWFEQHSPGVMLAPYQGDWATSALRDAAHTIWEEYAACRLSAPFSQGDVETKRYASGLTTAIEGAFANARECIKAYRTHGDVATLLTETSRSIAEPLKIGAYLIGHLDGIGNEADLDTVCPACAESEFSSVFPRLRDSLREAWKTRNEWNGLEGVDGIVRVIQDALAQAGAIVTLRDTDPGSHVDAPFSADTMPNGEADMVAIRLREHLGLG